MVLSPFSIYFTFDGMEPSNNTLYYTFKFEGKFKSLDALTVLTTQLNFVYLISEVKERIFPEVKMDFRIKGITKGSLNIHHLVEVGVVSGMFVLENYEYLQTTFKIISDLVKLKTFLGDKKADKVEKHGDQIHIHLNGDHITVESNAFNIYQTNGTFNNAIVNIGRALDDAKEVTGMKLSSNELPQKLEIKRKGFKKLKEKNPYLETDRDEDILRDQHFYIKKPHLFPEKNRNWNWDVIHRGRDIKVSVKDLKLMQKIDQGYKIGKGDKIIGDLRIFLKFDKRMNTFLETGKFEIFNISEIVHKDEASTFEFPEE